MWSRRSFVRVSILATAGAFGSTAPSEGMPAVQGVGRPSGRRSELTRLTIREAADLVRRRKISPVDLTSACLQQIERLNPVLNAFITVTADTAMKQAREAEEQIQRGKWRGPLHGIPIGLKDLVDTAGVKTTCASAVFANRIPTEDAEVVSRLQRAGAILIGKHNMQEFAY